MDANELIKYGSVMINPLLNPASYYTTYVIVVGCGGTGGRLIPALAQHIKNHNETIANVVINKQFLKHDMKLVLCDADTVEQKNLLRQNFHSFDVGLNKAEVLAKRFSALFGLDIDYITDYITPQNKSLMKYGTYDTNVIIFDCTDNLAARKEIEAQARGTKTCIISCGNEDTFGQVLFSCRGSNMTRKNDVYKKLFAYVQNLRKAIAEPSMTYKGAFDFLPTLLELYPNFKDTSKVSCTEMALQDEQSMPINSLVAQLAFNVFYNLVAGNTFKYNMVKCSTNNIYDTKFVSHPLALLELYYTALMGESGKKADDCFAEAQALNLANKDNYYIQRVPYDSVKAFADKYGKTAAPFLSVYLESNYSLSVEQQVYLNGAINGMVEANEPSPKTIPVR